MHLLARSLQTSSTNTALAQPCSHLIQQLCDTRNHHVMPYQWHMCTALGIGILNKSSNTHLVISSFSSSIYAMLTLFL